MAEQAREGTEVEDLTRALVRLGARKLIQELLEAEVTELLGRGRYERREPGREGARNGYKPRALRWAEGRLEIDAPHRSLTLASHTAAPEARDGAGFRASGGGRAGRL